MNYKIIGKYIKELNFNIPKPETFFLLSKDIANYKINNPNTKLKKIHFYAFGGIKKTSDWLKTVNKSDLSFDGQIFVQKN